LLLKDFTPGPAVAEFVQLFRIIHLVFDKGQPVPFKAYPPRPEHCLAFYPLDTEKVQYAGNGKVIEHIPVVLYGQQTEVTHRFIGHQFLVLQIIFYPGSLYRLTGIPAKEMTNDYLDAETILSSELRNVNEQLYHAKGYESMIRIAENYVLELMKRQKKAHHLIDDACKLILNLNGNISLNYLARESCLSPRQLERKFAERTGVNPKLYARVTRFDKVFRLKNSKPMFDWLRIALECGYHDYQHLVKDYKDFTGLTPTGFHQVENNAPERTFGLSENFYKD
jgi:AraC-like DNA-binding protein